MSNVLNGFNIPVQLLHHEEKVRNFLSKNHDPEERNFISLYDGCLISSSEVNEGDDDFCYFSLLCEIKATYSDLKHPRFTLYPFLTSTNEEKYKIEQMDDYIYIGRKVDGKDEEYETCLYRNTPTNLKDLVIQLLFKRAQTITKFGFTNLIRLDDKTIVMDYSDIRVYVLDNFLDSFSYQYYILNDKNLWEKGEECKKDIKFDNTIRIFYDEEREEE